MIMSTITQEVFTEKFGDIMMHGLDSNSTYIPLRTNARYGLNVAIRPRVLRISTGVVLFGGTLRVGYTLDERHRPVKTNITDISNEVRVQRLTDFGKGFAWAKKDEKRFSTIIGVGIAASAFDGAAAITALETNGVAADFINRLERTYKQYNGVTFGNNKGAAIEALNAAWMLQSNNPRIFKELQEFTPLPEEIVGKQSPVLNKAQDKYCDNVVSFQQKIDDWAEQAAQVTEEEDSA
jgi:hypothetical protein